MFGIVLQLVAYVASEKYCTDGRNAHSKETAKKMIAGYAEQIKADYIKEYEDRGLFHSPEYRKYYEDKAEEYKQTFLNNIVDFMKMPCI
jgi:hypothetical protein